jgi:hypothetical protein
LSFILSFIHERKATEGEKEWEKDEKSVTD